MRKTEKPKAQDSEALEAQITVAFLPWLWLKKPVKVGPVTFHPYLCGTYSKPREVLNGIPAEHTEIVMLTSAIQRLLEARSGRENEFAQAFVGLRLPGPGITVSSSIRLTRTKSRPFWRPTDSLQEVWIRDLYRMRNAFAHGRTKDSQRVWSEREHLLFGTFAFPLLLKLKLQKAGLYNLTVDDQRSCWAFDHLLDADDIFQVESSKRGLKESAWNRIMLEAELDRMGHLGMEYLERRERERDTVSGRAKDD